MKLTFTADFHCAGCADNVKRHLDNLSGVSQCGIDLESGEITVTTEDDCPLTESAVKTEIKKAAPTLVFAGEGRTRKWVMILKGIFYCLAAICFVLTLIPYFEPASLYLYIGAYVLIAHQLMIDVLKCFRHCAFYDDAVVIFTISVITFAFGEYFDALLICAIWHVANLIEKFAMKKSGHAHAEGGSKSAVFFKYAKILIPVFIVTGTALILILKFVLHTDSWNTIILSIIALSCPCPFIIGFTMLHVRTEAALEACDNLQIESCPAYSDRKRKMLDKELSYYSHCVDTTHHLGAKYKVALKSHRINLQNIIAICVLKVALIFLSSLLGSVLIAVSADIVLIILAVLNSLRIR